MTEISYKRLFVPPSLDERIAISSNIQDKALRGLVAQRSFSAGDVIFTELPLVSTLQVKHHRTRCDVCFQRSATPLKCCSRCKSAWYCSTKCQRYSWNEQKHSLLCVAFEKIAKQDNNPSLVGRIQQLSGFMLPIPALLQLNLERLNRKEEMKSVPCASQEYDDIMSVKCPAQSMNMLAHHTSSLQVKECESIAHMTASARDICALALESKINDFMKLSERTNIEGREENSSSDAQADDKTLVKDDFVEKVNFQPDRVSFVDELTLEELVSDMSLKQTSSHSMNYNDSKHNSEPEFDICTQSSTFGGFSTPDHFKFIDAREAFYAYGRIVCNSISISLPSQEIVGQAVYPLFSLINHSCLPNVEPQFLFEQGYPPRLILRVIARISAGDPIYFTYQTPPLMGSKLNYRCEALKKTYHFECDCTVCLFLWTPQSSCLNAICSERELDKEHRRNETCKTDTVVAVELSLAGQGSQEAAISVGIAERGVPCTDCYKGLWVPHFSHDQADSVRISVFMCTVCESLIPVSMGAAPVLESTLDSVKKTFAFPSISAAKNNHNCLLLTYNPLVCLSNDSKARNSQAVESLRESITRHTDDLRSKSKISENGVKSFVTLQYLRRVQLSMYQILRQNLLKYKGYDKQSNFSRLSASTHALVNDREYMEADTFGSLQNLQHAHSLEGKEGSTAAAEYMKKSSFSSIVDLLLSEEHIDQVFNDNSSTLAFEVLNFVLMGFDGYVQRDLLFPAAQNATLQFLAQRGLKGISSELHSLSEFAYDLNEESEALSLYKSCLPVLVPPVIETNSLHVRPYLSVFTSLFKPRLHSSAGGSRKAWEEVINLEQWLDEEETAEQAMTSWKTSGIQCISDHEQRLDKLAMSSLLKSNFRDLGVEARKDWVSDSKRGWNKSEDSDQQRDPLLHPMHIWRQELFYPLKRFVEAQIARGRNSVQVESTSSLILKQHEDMEFALVNEMSIQRAIAVSPVCSPSVSQSRNQRRRAVLINLNSPQIPQALSTIIIESDDSNAKVPKRLDSYVFHELLRALRISQATHIVDATFCWASAAFDIASRLYQLPTSYSLYGKHVTDTLKGHFEPGKGLSSSSPSSSQLFLDFEEGEDEANLTYGRLRDLANLYMLESISFKQKGLWHK